MRLIPILGVALTLSACGDPLAGVNRLSDVDVVAQTPAAALPDAEELSREGFIGTSAAQGDVPAEVANAQLPEAPGAGGFFRGLIKRAANADPAAAIAADVAQSQEEVTLAALPPEADAPVIDAAPAERGGGLFGGGRATGPDVVRAGPDALDVPFGTVLPFGQIARVCDARGKPLGEKVDSNGRRGFTLYDSNADIRDKRTFYVTGFRDDCPRQFTAANALFGAPSFYEQIRFSPAGENLPYAATDKAYDKVKSATCRAAKNKPCGGKIDTLDANTVFLTAYEFGEINGQWKEFLVHDGTVLASAVKSAN